MCKRIVTTLLILGLLSLSATAQTPIAKAFSDMKSSDPVKVKNAKDNLINLLVDEMPIIEKDTATICGALTDPDAYIRLQATGILQTIVLAAPSHNEVVLSCAPGLIADASDPEDRVRNNALFALAMNPSGPPSDAHKAFIQALGSTNFRSVELGAAGLLKEDGGHNAKNNAVVEQALAAAPDSKHKLNLLYAIGGSGVPSEALFQASQRYIHDPDPEIQQAAIEAVAATGTDRAKVVTIMQNLEDSPIASSQAKVHAKAIISRILPAQSQ